MTVPHSLPVLYSSENGGLTIFSYAAQTILRNLIDPDTANNIREYVLAHIDEGRQNAPGDINLVNLLDHGDQFTKLVTHPRLLTAAPTGPWTPGFL